MKVTRSGTLLLAAMLATSVAVAQAGAGAQAAAPARVELAVTYDGLHANSITAQSFWMQGGAVELEGQFYRGLGVVARVEGLHARANSTGVPLSLVTAVFGPRYTVETRSRRYAIFAEALTGEANGFQNLFSLGSGPVGAAHAGTESSADSLAVDAGGGLDVRINPRLAIRAVRASYLGTRFPNTTNNFQNSLSLSAGIVLRFSK